MSSSAQGIRPPPIPNMPFHHGCTAVRKALSNAHDATENWDQKLPTPQSIRDLLIQVHGIGRALRTLAIEIDHAES